MGDRTLPVRLRLIDAEEDREPIFDTEQEFEFSDPRMIAEITFTLGGLTFPAPGEYRFQLWAGGEFLMERRLIVNQIEGQET